MVWQAFKNSLVTIYGYFVLISGNHKWILHRIYDITCLIYVITCYQNHQFLFFRGFIPRFPLPKVKLTCQSTYEPLLMGRIRLQADEEDGNCEKSNSKFVLLYIINWMKISAPSKQHHQHHYHIFIYIKASNALIPDRQ